MFSKLFLIMAFVGAQSAVAAYAPGGPTIGLGCSNSGTCMAQIPFSVNNKIIPLSAGDLSYTTANYYTVHRDGPTNSAQSYQVAATGSLVCFGWQYLASTTTTLVFGYGDTSVSNDSPTGPTNPMCFEADGATCGNANGSGFKVGVANTSYTYVPHIMVFPAGKYPFLRLIGTNTFMTIVNMDCYQN